MTKARYFTALEIAENDIFLAKAELRHAMESSYSDQDEYDDAVERAEHDLKTCLAALEIARRGQ